MVGVVVGQTLGHAFVKKYFPEEGRIANLDFGYSSAELDELQSGTLPAGGRALLAAKKKRRTIRSLKITLATGAPALVVFGALALTADVPTSTRWAIFLLGLGFVVAIQAVGAVVDWYSYGRYAKPHALRQYTAPAIKKHRSHTISFGKAAAAPSWDFSSADAAKIDHGTEYRVHHVHDVLVYLEPVDPQTKDH